MFNSFLSKQIRQSAYAQTIECYDKAENLEIGRPDRLEHYVDLNIGPLTLMWNWDFEDRRANG